MNSNIRPSTHLFGYEPVWTRADFHSLGFIDVAKIRFAGTVLMILLSVSNSVQAQTPDIGGKAPDFTLSTPDGHPLSLSDMTRRALLCWWFSADFPAINVHTASGRYPIFY
jgi:hypothetical protein